MADFTQEIELLKQATRNVEQLWEVARAVETKLAEEPAGARSFIRPSSQLLQKLLEAQGCVERLLQLLYCTETLETTASR